MMSPYLKMRMENKAKGSSIRAEGGTLWLYDVIASDDEEAAWFGGVSPRQFMDALSKTSGPVTMRINSPGGSVFGAQAMVAAMRAHGQPITAQVDALAASAASVIACECAALTMAPGAMLMIHKAWGMTVGNADDHTQVADLLAKLDGQIADTYARRSSGTQAQFLDLMAAETWMTAEEAVAAGLADSVMGENNQRPQARWNLSAYAKAPELPKALTLAPSYNDADMTFATHMVPQMEAAIATAKQVIGAGMDQEIMCIAAEIISNQCEQMDTLAEWIAGHGMTATPPLPAPEDSAKRQRQLAARLAASEI
jgi:ATP-dependent Clp protease protease subunit